MEWYECYNIDCIEGSKKYLDDNSVDLIITDPPYGINGDKLHKHYNRDETYIIDGYTEISIEKYPDFSIEWIKEAERVLRPGGSIYIISGYTNLVHILNALDKTKLIPRNHIIWKYNFGVYTEKKFVTSHYHILYYIKPPLKKVTFNTYSRYRQSEKFKNGRSKIYRDLEDVWKNEELLDVWEISRKYKPRIIKNKNELPEELLIKMIQYSSNKKDLVCDFFLGSFSTIKVAVKLYRRGIGFEINKKAYRIQMRNMKKVIPGSLLPELKKPKGRNYTNQGKKWTENEIKKLLNLYKLLMKKYNNKTKSINELSKKFKRGYFSILNVIKKYN